MSNATETAARFATLAQVAAAPIGAIWAAHRDANLLGCASVPSTSTIVRRFRVAGRRWAVAVDHTGRIYTVPMFEAARKVWHLSSQGVIVGRIAA